MANPTLRIDWQPLGSRNAWQPQSNPVPRTQAVKFPLAFMPKAPKREVALEPDPGPRPGPLRQRNPIARHVLEAYNAANIAPPTAADFFTRCPLQTQSGKPHRAQLERRTISSVPGRSGFVVRLRFADELHPDVGLQCTSEQHTEDWKGEPYKLWIFFPNRLPFGTPQRPRVAQVAAAPAFGTPVRRGHVAARDPELGPWCADTSCTKHGSAISALCQVQDTGDLSQYCSRHCLAARHGECDYKHHRYKSSPPKRQRRAAGALTHRRGRASSSSQVMEISDSDEDDILPASSSSAPSASSPALPAKERKNPLFGAKMIDLTLA
uniref:Uncharacterized protein n=1 Tax=Mycena chlorophos TaxID=658473 RepID=A0ABQ0KUS8_MYCCL|nr:predicted protein [Mycena chlorophos]